MVLIGGVYSYAKGGESIAVAIWMGAVSLSHRQQRHAVIESIIATIICNHALESVVCKHSLEISCFSLVFYLKIISQQRLLFQYPFLRDN